MTEKQLIDYYYTSKFQMEQVQGQIEEHFLKLAKKAIKAGRRFDVLDIMSRCPDDKIETKIADLLNRS